MSCYIITNYCQNKKYYLNDILHREDGPAVERVNGTKEWYKNGELHREDEPAIEFANGEKLWYLNNKCYGYDDEFSNKFWSKFIKTLIFS